MFKKFLKYKPNNAGMAQPGKYEKPITFTM